MMVPAEGQRVCLSYQVHAARSRRRHHVERGVGQAAAPLSASSICAGPRPFGVIYHHLVGAFTRIEGHGQPGQARQRQGGGFRSIVS